MTFLGTCTPNIHDGGGELDLACATHVFGYISLPIVLTGSPVIIGTISSCTVLFFGRFGYKKIAVAAHIWHLPRSPAREACLFF